MTQRQSPPRQSRRSGRQQRRAAYLRRVHRYGWRQRAGLGNPKMPAHDALTALGGASTVDHRGAKVGRRGRLVGEGPPTLIEGREGILDQLLGDGTIIDKERRKPQKAESVRAIQTCDRLVQHGNLGRFCLSHRARLFQR